MTIPQSVGFHIWGESISELDILQTAFLVGGFAASPWLFTRLEAALRTQQIRVCRPDHHTYVILPKVNVVYSTGVRSIRNKAVAEGAASYFIQQFVASRIAKYTYGTEVIVDYNEENPEHHLRRGRLRTRPSGRKFVPEGFQVVLSKVRAQIHR